MKWNILRGWVAGVGAGIAFFSAGCSPSTTSGGANAGNGKLRVLVTDRPFPFDLIEEATVTITRVEVRRSDECEDGCDDGLFCNGVETCADGACAAGETPCAEGQTCDEENDACMTPCTDDADCDDLAFCNGTEVCAEGFCAAGSAACADEFECDEVNHLCVAEDGDKNEDGDDGTVAENDADDPNDDAEDHDAQENDGEHGDGDGGPWIVVFEGEKAFNLLDLRNGRTDLLADVDVPAGTYTQMRLIVTEGQVTLKDGRTFPLRVPSGAQTGIKLHFTFEVGADEETQLLLDVDLSRAFKPVPGGHIEDVSMIRSFHFSPSVAMRLINLLEAGSVSGVVTTAADDVVTPMGGVAATAFDGDTEVTSTTTEADGSYTLGGLPTGTYRVEFSAAGYEDVVVENVSVEAESATENVDATMTTSEADATAQADSEPLGE